jgi:hypothetical protein
LLCWVDFTIEIFYQIEFGLSEFESLPNFITKLPEANDSINIEIDASALDHI